MKQTTITKPVVIGLCIFGFSAFMLATVVVLSLIPLYLPKKEVSLKEETKGNYALNYGTDAPGVSGFEIDNPQALADDLKKQLNLDNIEVKDAKFVGSSSKASGKKRRQNSDDQCGADPETPGDTFSIVIKIDYPKGCDKPCKADYDVKVKVYILDQFKKIKLNIKFKNGQALDVNMKCCGFKETKDEQVTTTTTTTARTIATTSTTTSTTSTTSTSTTTSTTSTTSTSTTTSTTSTRSTSTTTSTTSTTTTEGTSSTTNTVSGAAGPAITTAASTSGRRRRSVLQPSQGNAETPIGGCLMIGHNEKNKDLIKQLYKQHDSLRSLALGVESIPSVDGQSIDLTKLLVENKISKHIYNQLITRDLSNEKPSVTIKDISALQSHVLAWERVFEVNQPMLIVENDMQLNTLILNGLLPHLMNDLPANLSLLYFGGSVDNETESNLLDFNKFLWKVNGSIHDTHAYIISPHAAAALLDLIYPVQGDISSIIFNISMSESFDIFRTKYIQLHQKDSKPITQNDHESRILIPETFHFIWLNNDSVSARTEQYVALWKNFHPNWNIQIWTEETVRNGELYLHNQELYLKSMRDRNFRQASDILRYEILHQYGGIYIDFDFEPLKSIEPLLYGAKAFVAYESQYFICNGILGAVPEHELTKRLVMNLESNWVAFKDGTINQQTGPHFITKEVKEMQEEINPSVKDDFSMFAPHIFFPYAWYEQDPGHPYDPLAFGVHHFRPMAEIIEEARRKH